MFLKNLRIILGVLTLAGFVICTLSCDNNLGQELLYTKARNLHDKGHIDKAIEIYKKILTLPGEHDEVFYDLGVAYAQEEDFSKAQKQVILLEKIGRDDLARALANVISKANARRIRKQTSADKENN